MIYLILTGDWRESSARDDVAVCWPTRPLPYEIALSLHVNFGFWKQQEIVLFDCSGFSTNPHDIRTWREVIIQERCLVNGRESALLWVNTEWERQIGAQVVQERQRPQRIQTEVRFLNAWVTHKPQAVVISFVTRERWLTLSERKWGGRGWVPSPPPAFGLPWVKIWFCEPSHPWRVVLSYHPPHCYLLSLIPTQI